MIYNTKFDNIVESYFNSLNLYQSKMIKIILMKDSNIDKFLTERCARKTTSC